MKGVVLLAVIHILIIYQSRKNRPAKHIEMPAESVVSPVIDQRPLAERRATTIAPEFAILTTKRSTTFRKNLLQN